MASREVAASAARTVTGTSGVLSVERAALSLGLDVTAAGGATPSMTLSVEWSFDGGTTFLVGDPADAFTAKTAAGTAAKSFTSKGDAYRVRWTITGTAPSFTFSVREVQ